jgi:enoyl-CoA hydratase
LSSDADDILFDRRGTAGLVTLNRPQTLNAVTHHMVRALRRQLDAWMDDGAVTRVIVMANGGRAFSAGGDIRALYDQGKAGKQVEALEFFAEEYSLNNFIKRYPKPYVSLIDGIVMGGGVGISIHGSHRVAGDRYQFAMPEVGIGFFPDVGATWALPRLPGKTGTYLALTGERLKTADAIAAGAATHPVRSDRFADLRDALCGAVPVDAVLSAFAEPPGRGELTERRPAIDRLFADARVEDILANLDREGKSGSGDAAWAKKTADTIKAKSPLSLKVALEQMRRGADCAFDECMRMEFRIVSRVVYGHDLYEGVRAVIVEKDNMPRWRPPTLSEVTDAEVARHFEALGRDELVLS